MLLILLLAYSSPIPPSIVIRYKCLPMPRGSRRLWDYVPFLMNLFIASILSSKGIQRIVSVLGSSSSSTDAWSRCWAIAFTITTASSACHSLYLLHATWTGRLTPAQHADWRLFQIACIVPLTNVLGCLSLPSFLISKHWTAYLVAMMVIGNVLQQLPPAQALVHWAIKAPILG